MRFFASHPPRLRGQRAKCSCWSSSARARGNWAAATTPPSAGPPDLTPGSPPPETPPFFQHACLPRSRRCSAARLSPQCVSLAGTPLDFSFAIHTFRSRQKTSFVKGKNTGSVHSRDPSVRERNSEELLLIHQTPSYSWCRSPSFQCLQSSDRSCDCETDCETGCKTGCEASRWRLPPGAPSQAWPRTRPGRPSTRRRRPAACSRSSMAVRRATPI